MKNLVWHFTFSNVPMSSLTLDEDHPELPMVMLDPETDLVGATLINTQLFSLFDTQEEQYKAFVHSVPLGPSKLKRVFRRVEVSLIDHVKKVTPAFEFEDNNTRDLLYCFAFPDKVFITQDSRFTRRNLCDND
jgi:hypothetical protein